VTNIFYADPIVEGETTTVRGRLQNQSTLFALVQDDIDEIWLRVFDLDTGARVWEDSVSVVDHIFDTMQIDGWEELREYNFADDQPSDDWMQKVEGGKRYKLQYEFRLVSARLIRRAVILPIEEWSD